MATGFDWKRAEAECADRERRLRQAAERRLRRLEDAARWRTAFDGPPVPPAMMLDSDRLSATLSERLGPRGMVQLVLWGLMGFVGTIVLFSFFTTPLMEAELAIKALLAGVLLALSYIL